MAKSSRPTRPGKNVPGYLRLVPLLPALFFSTFWVLSGGCGRNFSLEARQRELSDASIQNAVQAEIEGDSSRADAAAADAVNLFPSTQKSEAVVAVARDLMRAGRPHPALRLLTSAVHSPSLNDNPNVYLMLARAQEQVGNQAVVAQSLDEAVRRAGSLRNIPPGDKSKDTQVLDLLVVGSFWSDVENPRADKAKSLDALRAAYALMPENPVVQNALGYTLADLGTDPAERKQGLGLTRKAADQIPDNGIILDSLGWALYRTGDLDQAAYVLRKAVDLEEDLPETHCHLGIVFAARKEYRDAAIELKRAVQLWPQYEQAQQALQALPLEALATPTPTPLPPPLNAPVSAPAVVTPLAPTPSPTPAPRSAGK